MGRERAIFARMCLMGASVCPDKIATPFKPCLHAEGALWQETLL